MDAVTFCLPVCVPRYQLAQTPASPHGAAGQHKQTPPPTCSCCAMRLHNVIHHSCFIIIRSPPPPIRTSVLAYLRVLSAEITSPHPPVHNGGPCVWDVYGVARPGSGQCPALPAARSGLCSTGSHGHRTNPSLPFPVMDPSSFQPPFPFFGFGIAAQQERAVFAGPPCAVVRETNPFIIPLRP